MSNTGFQEGQDLWVSSWWPRQSCLSPHWSLCCCHKPWCGWTKQTHQHWAPTRPPDWGANRCIQGALKPPAATCCQAWLGLFPSPFSRGETRAGLLSTWDVQEETAHSELQPSSCVIHIASKDVVFLLLNISADFTDAALLCFIGIHWKSLGTSK